MPGSSVDAAQDLATTAAAAVPVLPPLGLCALIVLLASAALVARRI